jgi:non-specific serine/threonine protein kinase/serine/threonine-protein kinase
MGEVWLAEQREPVHRQVAIKVIKAGMDSAQVVARFEAERQALAMMDHPAIARVFDGGTNAQGRPYFVMEYVKGEPITTYCDRHLLSTRERLELFIQVCEGVQHAHQKGVIHRDLKPSNVLVTIQDERPVPKIIDFGVAKATAHSLTERTLVTELGALVGTPEYMSPEQAEMGGLDIDTRTDIYALGILLYELLTGALPFERKNLQQAGMADIQRIIRERDAPRPSARVTQMGDASQEAAKNRRTVPSKLMGELRRDLDWIALRAIEKDRTRRYQTANALAADVRRHLNNEPVLARAPSAAYRAQKFVRRHKGAVAAAAAVLLALVAGVVAASLGMLRARESERVAVREAASARAVTDFLVSLFEVNDPSEARGRAITASEMLSRGAKQIDGALADQPEVRARMLATLGKVYSGLGLYREAEPLAEEGLKTSRRVLGAEHPDTLLAMNTLANLYWYEERLDEAEALYTELIATRRRVDGPEAAVTLRVQYDLMSLYALQERYPEAERLGKQTLEAQRRLLGDEHPHTLGTMHNLASVYHRQKRYGESARINETVLEQYRRKRGNDHPETIDSIHNLATSYQYMGRKEDAEKLYREAIERSERVRGAAHPYTANSAALLGSLLTEQRRFDEAERLLSSAYRTQADVLGEKHSKTRLSAKGLADLYEAWGKPEAAREWRAKSTPQP